MRRFSTESTSGRKVVVLDLEGARLTVLKVKPDGTSDRTVRTLGSEDEASRAQEQLVRELVSRGYAEHKAATARASGAAPKSANRADRPSASPAARPAPVVTEQEEDDRSPLYELAEEAVATSQPAIPRLQPLPAAAPSSEAAPKKKKKKKGKKKQAQGDGLDKRVIAGVAGVGLLLLGGLFYIIYDGFLKPPSIVGTWRGANTDYEIGGPIVYTEYDLILDEKKNASMTFPSKDTETGTYSLKGNRLKLSLKDKDGEATDLEYKIVLGRVTLDLNDPNTGKRIVQLIRFREPPVVSQTKAKPSAAPTDVAPPEPGKEDPAEDARLASEQLSVKDQAFRVRYPKGWEADTGSRPDNTYSWAKFTKDSATIEIYADVAGSLMSGSDSAGQYEEGSEFAPVHKAHELYKRTAAEEFSDFADGQPAVLKGSGLGEGRISIFTASTGGLFSSKLRGYHATLLSRDRRVTVLAHCPEKEFPKLKPTFLAVCRSLSR
jgi:hypothetical protein